MANKGNSNTATFDKTELEKKITEYKNNNIFAETKVEKPSIPLTENNNNIAVNQKVSNYDKAEQYEAKGNLIDKTVNSINNNITALQNNLKEEKDPLLNGKITKEITSLQKEAVTLKQKADEAHKKALELNDSIKVTALSNADDTTLATNLELYASEDIKKAAQKLIDANNTQDSTEKENLRKEASELEKIAETKQLEALEIFGIANVNTYYINSLKIDKIRVEDVKNTQLANAGMLEKESKYYFEKAKALRESIKDYMTIPQKKIILEDAKTNEQTAILKQSEALDIYTKASTAYADNIKTITADTNQVTNENATSANNNITNPVLTNQNTKIQNNNTDSLTNTNNVVTTETKPVSPSLNNKNEIDSTTANTTVTNTSSDYKGIYLNANNKILLNVDSSNLVPLNPVLPSQIIYKVQISALMKHVAPEVFKGITPLVGESSGTGIVRYMAGLFAKFEDADASKNQIRTMGYPDAFVVAYYNGKRITVAESMALLKNNDTISTTYTDLDNKTYISQGANTVNINPITNINTVNQLSNPIINIKGLFYSVQVGVYAKPITSIKLFNITPLYDEFMANGYYRYISGTYGLLQDAVTAKKEIVKKGVTDAFVVAYYNGKKISIPEAEKLFSENAFIASSANTLNEPAITKSDNAQTNYTQNTSENTTNISDTINKSGIVFKVQIGAFEKNIPVEVFNQFLDLVADKGLEHNKNADGLTVYTSGNFNDYTSANDYKNSLVAKNIKDAFVVAFQNGQNIAVTKAIELLK